MSEKLSENDAVRLEKWLIDLENRVRYLEGLHQPSMHSLAEGESESDTPYNKPS